MSLLTTQKIMWLVDSEGSDAPTSRDLPARKLTWKPKEGPIKTSPLKKGLYGFPC